MDAAHRVVSIETSRRLSSLLLASDMMMMPSINIYRRSDPTVLLLLFLLGFCFEWKYQDWIIHRARVLYAGQTSYIYSIAAIGIFCCCLTCCCVCVHHLFYITQHKGRLIYPRQYHQRLVYNPPRSIYIHAGSNLLFKKAAYSKKKGKFRGKIKHCYTKCI